MTERPLIEYFEVNVAKYTGKKILDRPQALHFCRVRMPDNLHDHLILAMERLRLAFPEDQYELSVTGIPYRSGYRIDESKLIDGELGYPK